MHVLDEDGQKLGMGILKAQGDWMTDKPVRVSGVISLEKPGSGSINLEIRENYPGNARKPYTLVIPLTVPSR